MNQIACYMANPTNTFNQYMYMSSGTSGEADRVYNLYEDALKELRETELYSKEFEKIEKIIKSLNHVFTETCVENWNDEGAMAVTYDTFQKACEFINFLPKILPEPEISADPDGEISIEWYGKNNRVFSVSINGSGKLSYAALYGNKSFHGVEYFNCEIPKRLLRDIKEILGF